MVNVGYDRQYFVADFFKPLCTGILPESDEFCGRYDENISAYYFLGNGVF